MLQPPPTETEMPAKDEDYLPINNGYAISKFSDINYKTAFVIHPVETEKMYM